MLGERGIVDAVARLDLPLLIINGHDAGAFQDNEACTICHGGYDSAVEPGHNFQGSMMSQAARDPLFYAALTVDRRKLS